MIADFIVTYVFFFFLRKKRLLLLLLLQTDNYTLQGLRGLEKKGGVAENLALTSRGLILG